MKDILAPVRNGESLTGRQELWLIARLSLPAILAQISSIMMQYIDASMVGRLGTNAAASIGLVSTSTWLIGGVGSALATGFTVQVAHAMGAKEEQKARNIVRYGLISAITISLLVMALCTVLGPLIPVWMGADPNIRKDASLYFMIFGFSFPFLAIDYAAGGMLQCSGNMRVPSILNISMCFLDVIFNYIFIFEPSNLSIFGFSLKMPGLGLGVLGAALGTACAEIFCALSMLFFLLAKSETLSLRREKYLLPYIQVLKKALKISIPIAFESAIMGMAYVASTKIVTPIGVSSISAHSFSITVESLCYMPGYGISQAATTVVGQCVGANRKDLARRLGWMTVGLGVFCMAMTGLLMYIYAPYMIGFLTNDSEIRELGSTILRIEAFAEPMYAVSIVATGILRGYADTLIPSLMNLFSMWCVRIPLSAYLAASMGLKGVWIAMAGELIFRGLIYFVRLVRKDLEIKKSAC